MRRADRRWGKIAPFFAILLIALSHGWALGNGQNDCKGSVYLTFDTGHMGVAGLVAQVLARQDVRVTFFAADERTQDGGSSLDEHWAPWWRARAAEGHVFASHTMSHLYWRADAGVDAAGKALFRVRPSAGLRAEQTFTVTEDQYCQEIRSAAQRLQAMTGLQPLPLYRAPGGKTSPALLGAAKRCGYTHVGWSPAGFLGDELASENHSNQALLARSLRDIRSGDILLAHLGIWSRKDPWAPAVLEPLIQGLKQRGLCFRTLAEHPSYALLLRQAAP